ncbi:MAG: M13 family metallopeptidase, partial [Muribaculum sp.]|nr:M13 family metallopeptidase [Muribaculum sp.]
MKITRLFIGAMLLGGCTLAMSAEEHLKSLNPAYIDKSTPAGVDFYHHVNRGWQEANPLTPEHSRYGQFNILNDTAEVRIKEIVLNLGSTNPEPGSVAFKVWTIYSQAMDSIRRNREGAAPIQADLKRIETAAPADMDSLFLWLHGNYASPFFGAGP